MIKKLLILVPFIAFLGFSIRFIVLAKKSQELKPNVGVVDGRLLACPSESNCFSGKVQKVENDILLRLHDRLQEHGMSRESSEGSYLHFTDKSPLFGFVDDVEFLYFPKQETLYFRSSSRVGKSDLGANKKRISMLLKALGHPL